MPKSLKELLDLFYWELFGAHDAPEKIALGLGVGVFTGILPGAGPLAALFLAFILRVNRAAALLGSLLTNTWLSIATFLLSIKTGSSILRLDWQDVWRDWELCLRNFRWLDLFKLTIFKLILPVMVGYLVVAFCVGLIVYLITLIITKYTYKSIKVSKR